MSVRLKLDANAQCYKITKFTATHNHTTSSGEFKHYSTERRLDSVQKEHIQAHVLESVKFEIIEESDETYSVIYKIKDSTFNVSVAKSMNDCTCLCFSNFGLPCRHKKYIGTIFEENLIPNR